MADRFFTDKPLSLGEFILDGAEAHHLGTVRRFAVGDAVVLFNGDGAEYPAEIVEIGKKQAAFVIRERIEVSRELRFEVVVGSALPKADRFDFLLEKLVEAGATRFVPLITERSVVRPKGDKLGKWRRAVIEASKQCGRNKLMAIDNPLTLEQFLRSERTSQKWILDTGLGLGSPKPGAADSAFAVGPEGGFTVEELVFALNHRWEPVGLGSRTLRTETAAIAAVLWAANGQ